MRVLLLDVSHEGGIATYTDRLAEELARDGVDVRLAAPGARASGTLRLPMRPWEGLVATSRWRLWGRRLREVPVSTVAVLRAVSAARPDILHVHTDLVPRLDAPLLWVLARRVPVVVTAHDPVPHEGGKGKTRRDARVWAAVDAVIVHGEEARRVVAAAAPTAAVHIVPVDLRLGGDPVDRHAARLRLGVPEAPTALLLGLLRSYKGLDLLAEVWPMVVAECSDARLFLVGAAHGSREVLKRLRALPRVEVREGFVPDADIDSWAAAADVLVLPYRHGAHSGVLHRGLAAGTPVLGSPALAEEIERTGAGAAIPLDAERWAKALVAALGPHPLPVPTSPPGGATLAATITVYHDVLDRRQPTIASTIGAGDQGRPAPAR